MVGSERAAAGRPAARPSVRPSRRRRRVGRERRGTWPGGEARAEAASAAMEAYVLEDILEVGAGEGRRTKGCAGSAAGRGAAAEPRRRRLGGRGRGLPGGDRPPAAGQAGPGGPGAVRELVWRRAGTRGLGWGARCARRGSGRPPPSGPSAGRGSAGCLRSGGPRGRTAAPPPGSVLGEGDAETDK